MSAPLDTTRPDDPGRLAAWGLGDDQTLEALVDGLVGVVGALVGFDARLAGDGELGAGLVAVQQVKAKLCAAETGLLDVFDARRLYRADGSRSTATWLAARSSTPREVVQGLVRLARRLRRAPRTRDALAQGRLGPERAEVLARQAASPRQPVADAFGDAEGELVEAAVGKGFGEFLGVVGYWRDRVDPDDADRRAQRGS